MDGKKSQRVVTPFTLFRHNETVQIFRLILGFLRICAPIIFSIKSEFWTLYSKEIAFVSLKGRGGHEYRAIYELYCVSLRRRRKFKSKCSHLPQYAITELLTLYPLHFRKRRVEVSGLYPT